MINFFVYKGNYKLGKQPLGTEGKMLFKRKTVKGAINYVNNNCVDWEHFVIYSYTNFYDEKTYKKEYEQ